MKDSGHSRERHDDDHWGERVSDAIPVNPDVLRWARTSLGLSVEDVAARMKKDAADIEAWERGESSPTYVQLETLAYDVYKRPLALFFFPAPPDEEPIERSFRTLPEQELKRIPSRMRYLLRKARVLQLNLAELCDDKNPAERNILRDIEVPVSVSVRAMAQRVREYLGIPLPEQQQWGNADTALKRWRESLVEHGVFVFKDSFNPPGKKSPERAKSPYSGFCLYDAEFPIVYVNNNAAKSRQIFTLFHELAHLLMHTGGVDKTRDEAFIELLHGDSQRIEVLCNRFAAEFLVPSGDFNVRTRGMPVNADAVSDLARLYSVSREVVLRRFLDADLVSRRTYEAFVKKWDEEKIERKGSGGRHLYTKGAYLGQRYVELVFGRYHQNRISLEQAADYLDEKAQAVPKMEEWLFRQGVSV